MAKLTTYIVMGVISAFVVAMMFVGGVPDSSDISGSDQVSYDQTSPIPEAESKPEPIAEVKPIVSYEFPPGYNNPDVTDMQKTAYFDTYLKDEYVQWSGTVSDVSMNGRNTVKLSVDHGSSMTSNALIRLADGQLEKAITLKRGDTVTYTAKMTRWGSFLGFYGDNGVII